MRSASGLDPLEVKLENDKGLTASADAIFIEDFLNGQYKVTYAVPAAGEWKMTLGIDENAYDVRPAPCAPPARPPDSPALPPRLPASSAATPPLRPRCTTSTSRVPALKTTP